MLSKYVTVPSLQFIHWYMLSGTILCIYIDTHTQLENDCALLWLPCYITLRVFSIWSGHVNPNLSILDFTVYCCNYINPLLSICNFNDMFTYDLSIPFTIICFTITIIIILTHQYSVLYICLQVQLPAINKMRLVIYI